MRYGPGGQLVELISRNATTGDQVTRYEYGVTLAESGIASNDLLRAEVYPDAADSSDRVAYSYNRQGQRIRMQDQNGSMHEYEYDALGRQTADKVTTLGAGVDGAVRRIGQSYEVRGLVENVTSYSDAAGTTPVNEVQNVYNSFGQLKEQYQEHSGSVNTGTTPKVEYAYADGSANTTRSTSLTYPNGRVLDYLYDDTHADKLSRVRTLRWDGTDVCRYSYLGLNTFVATDYSQPQVKLDYALGSGANPYTGFDRFGRIVDLLWARYGAGSSSSSSGGPGNDLVHLKYGYDRASNRTHREDLVAQSYGKDFDELYEYDGLHRLKKFHRGRLTDDNQAITSPTLQQGWVLDATGNWQNFTQNDQADADQTLDQQRLHNRVNEITQIARTVGANWATPEYDRNGNMTVIPQPKEMTQTFQGTWDAWNRQVKLTEPNGSGGWQTLAEYQYDGQTWRTAAKSYALGVLDETRHFYFTSRWQDIEERLGAAPNSANAQQQYTWGQRFIDNLILRDRDTGGGSLNERLYALQDANWSVTAIIGVFDYVLERFAFTAYGRPQCFDASFEIHPSGFDWETLYTGRRCDATTLMQLYRNRYYNALLGRFISRDPVGYVGGSNAYRYVHNNPIGLVDPWGLVECDNDNLGARRGVAGDTVFSPGNNNPDFAKGALDFIIVLTAISDVPIPGVTDIGDLLNKLNPNSPWGIEVAMKLAEIKDFGVLLRLNAGQASVWTKVQCQECKCTTWFTGFPFYRTQKHFDWVNYGKEKWVQCDLGNTEWGQREKRKRASTVFIDEDVLFFELLDLDDVAEVKQQCAEQAEESCEK
jgi:RHS repeat-associated protein